MERHVLYPKEKVHELQMNEYEKKYTRKGRESVYYYNIPVAYDIETSSFRDENNQQTAVTYAHAINVDGYCFLTRTWEDFKYVMKVIGNKAGLNRNNRMIVYIHNLAYEFQFMKKHFNFYRVFNNGGERNQLTALTTDGIEFRCSFMLSGLNLANTAKNLAKYKIEKMEGDLDYTIIRSPETPLTPKELGYILNDVVIIEYFIREAIEEAGGNINKVPLTNTGYVREYVRNNTIMGKEKDKKEYRDLMKQLTIEEDEYIALKAAFAGGFTHANVEYVGKTETNVTARDYASSYPARQIAYKFPMSKGEEYTPKDLNDFYNCLQAYCCLFYVKLIGVERKANEGYISQSKLTKSEFVTTNNGRVETASTLEMWVTEVDFELIALSYNVDRFEVGRMWRYKRGYLPTSLIESIIKLYEDKTKFKDVKDKITEYNRSKGMLNSVYGMIVMDIVREEFEWDDADKEIIKNTPDTTGLIEKNNKSRKRFLFYPWGVWTTAYARYDLFTVIVKLEHDYRYSDTDSIYYVNDEKNLHIFEEKNEMIENQLKAAAEHHGFDVERFSPKDPKGISRTIGIWSHDGFYSRFKTLGAKRYMVEDPDPEYGGIKLTVSGVNKNKAVPYLLETYGKDGVFDAFNENLLVPEGACGKSTHTYIDFAKKGTMTDYNGELYNYHELSGVHLEETSYQMSISNEFAEFIEKIQSA